MTIPAIRFQSLTADFNVASKNFAAIFEDGVLNSAEVKDVTASAKELIGQLKTNNVVEITKDALKAVTRVTQDVFGTFADLSKMAESTLTGMIDEIFPASSSATKNLLKGMLKVCRNDALGRGLGLGGDFKFPKCSGFGMGAGKCPPNAASDLINKATGADLNQIKKLLGNILKQIVALGSLGFSANLCGVFAAITQGITDRNILGAAAGILLNQEGLRGNVKAVFDISKSLDSFPIVSTFPRTISNISENFTKPFGAVQNDIAALAGMTNGALGAISNVWNKAADGIDSIANMGKASKDYCEVLESGSKDQSLDIDNLDVPQEPQDAPAYTAAYLA